MELSGRKVLVVGLGKTGVATSKFLIERGADVRATDIAQRDELSPDALELESMGVEIMAGRHRDEDFSWSDTVVLSPGVPFSQPMVREAIKNGKEALSEIELASRFIKTPIVAVTGSNGKTTTSTLVADILEASGKRVFLGGNIGAPAIKIAGIEASAYDILVLELSSFQLQGVSAFKPDIGVLLNISPNHLDHHLSFEEYVDSKMKLISNQDGGDLIVYNYDDDVLRERIAPSNAKKIPFGANPQTGGLSYSGRVVTYGSEKYDLSSMKLMGAHNVENAMAAIAVAETLGCPKDIVENVICNFSPLAHRIELIAKAKGAAFYNDSKSTSPGATLRALQSVPAPIVLIVGGKDKGADYGVLREEIKNNVKRLIIMGESKKAMSKALSGLTETVFADTLREAVNLALEKMKNGDSILFSPACSSFDMFSSYEERGMKYAEIVKNILL